MKRDRSLYGLIGCVVAVVVVAVLVGVFAGSSGNSGGRPGNEESTKGGLKTSAPGGQQGWPVVVIDPAHGGSDPGLVFGTADEKNENLDVARVLRDKLRSMGYVVEMTRDSDVSLTAEERVAKIKAVNPTGVIVVACETYHDNPSYKARTYFSPRSIFPESSEMLAICMNWAFRNTFGASPTVCPTDSIDASAAGAGHNADTIYVLDNCDARAAVLSQDLAKTPQWWTDTEVAAKGIQDYFNVWYSKYGVEQPKPKQ